MAKRKSRKPAQSDPPQPRTMHEKVEFLRLCVETAERLNRELKLKGPALITWRDIAFLGRDGQIG